MRALFAAAFASVALVAAGCGGDGRLSQEELVSEADEICAQAEDELEGLDQPQSLEDVMRFAEEGIPVIRDAVDDLEELEPPEELEDEWNRWIELNREGIRQAEELRDAAGEGDAEEAQRLAQELQQSEERADELAREIGLDECADA